MNFSNGRYRDCNCRNRSCALCVTTEELKKNYEKNFYKTKFGLVIRGDTASTSRLYDSIASGAIPIFISEDIKYDALPFIEKFKSYDDFSFNIVPNFQNISAIWDQMQEIAQMPDTVLRKKFETLVKIRKELSWRHKNSTVQCLAVFHRPNLMSRLTVFLYLEMI